MAINIENEKINFTFTVSEINSILGILGDAPFVRSASLINTIQAQGSEQFAAIQAAADAVAEAIATDAPVAEAIATADPMSEEAPE